MTRIRRSERNGRSQRWNQNMEGKSRPHWKGRFGLLDWRLYAQGRIQSTDSGHGAMQQDSGSSLPIPMAIRRRASMLSKAVLAVVADLCARNKVDHIILASRHGELHRTLTLLQETIADELLSPTLFAQSVHSTSAGLATIAFKLEVPVTTVAARRDSFHMALVECSAYLALQPTHKVLLLAADEQLPELYAPYDDELNVDHVLGLILARGDNLVGEKYSATSDIEETERTLLPSAAAVFSRSLAERTPHWQIDTPSGSWRWSFTC